MAPPLVDPLLLANMESIAFVLELTCIMHNKINVLAVAMIDLRALLLHMLHDQSQALHHEIWNAVGSLCIIYAVNGLLLPKEAS